MATDTYTPAQSAVYDAGFEDATAGRKASPPAAGGALGTAYAAGFDAGKAAKTPTTTRTPGGKARTAPARKRSRGGAVRSSSRRAARSAGRQVIRPVERQVSSGLAALGTAVALAVLFNLLQNATYAAGALGGLTKALSWLDSPAPIRYRK